MMASRVGLYKCLTGQMLKSVGWASLLTHKELMSGMIFFKAAIFCYTKELVSLLTGFVGAVKEEHQDLFDPEKYSSYDAFADDLICLIDEMNLKSAVFVGHSMSGMIGCIASIKRSELFKRLVLVGASPRYINADEYEGGFKKSEIDDIVSNIEFDFQNWAAGFASLVVDARDPPSVETFRKSLANMRPEVALSVAKTVFYSDEREILDKVSIPCTIVQTTSDIVVPNSVAYYLQEKIKGKSTVEIIETNGHFPLLSAHQQLLDVLKGVLALSN
ncbi:hypothetical protein GH714_034480 [Hevea brasiliensis]|uniref:AB hydrolase-1 domain-containing protein n=1 Tax=Hevea brasiliensis TaxID=3981 RepID=A0A6A6KDC2_HEVBR|nr:hypothetical protein GH714_034480 [Hevea brasiliensis]